MYNSTKQLADCLINQGSQPNC